MRTISLFIVTMIGATCSVAAQDVLWAAGGSNLTVQPGTNIYVGGGISLDNNSSLTNKGNILLAKSLHTTADLTDRSKTSYYYGPGSFIFSGSGSQNISSANRLGKVEVDNNGLNLLSDVSADNWYLKQGRVNTGTYYAIVASAQADAIQADAANRNFGTSWFNGNLRRYITASSVGNYDFPVGNNAKAFRCELDNLNSRPLTGVRYIDASFSNGPVSNGIANQSADGKLLRSISNTGVWRLVPDATASNGAFDLKLFFNEFSGLSDNGFSVVNSLNGSGWSLPAGSVSPADNAPGRTVAGGYARRNNISTFDQFGIGIIAAADPKATVFAVFPNPVTNNEFYIRTGNTVKDLTLIAADGKEVNITGMSVQKDNLVKIALPTTIAKGMYTVRLNTNNGVQTNRIEVQ